MIITSPLEDAKDGAAQVEHSPPSIRDLPPSYSGPQTTSQPSVAPEATPKSLLPTKPTNHLALIRNNGSIRENFTIDPNLHIPLSLLSHLDNGEAESSRKNLKLESRNGAIDVGIWLVGDHRDDGKERVVPKRASLAILSHNSSIVAKVMSAPIPFNLEVMSYNGAITVYLPRSFQGPMTITSRNGSVNISSSLSDHATTFSEVNSTRRYFVGDFSGWSDSALERWNGDECVIEGRNGRIKVQYLDDVPAPKVEGKGSFLGKLFGI